MKLFFMFPLLMVVFIGEEQAATVDSSASVCNNKPKLLLTANGEIAIWEITNSDSYSPLPPIKLGPGIQILDMAANPSKKQVYVKYPGGIITLTADKCHNSYGYLTTQKMANPSGTMAVDNTGQYIIETVQATMTTTLNSWFIQQNKELQLNGQAIVYAGKPDIVNQIVFHPKIQGLFAVTFRKTNIIKFYKLSDKGGIVALSNNARISSTYAALKWIAFSHDGTKMYAVGYGNWMHTFDLILDGDNLRNVIKVSETRTTKSLDSASENRIVINDSGTYAFVSNDMPQTITTLNIKSKPQIDYIADILPKGASVKNLIISPGGNQLLAILNAQMIVFKIHDDGKLTIQKINPVPAGDLKGFFI